MRTPVAELKHTALINSLRACQLFAGLPAPDISNLAAITRLRSLSPGDYLFHEGDPATGFFVVQSGVLNVHRVNAAGKEQVIHLFRAGESFAEATLATERGYPADARALEASQVIHIPKAGFLDLLRAQPGLALKMLASMSLRLHTLVGQLEDLTLRDVETRLANWLLKRCPVPSSTEPAEIELRMTKRVLAAELGTVSETLSRTLAKLRESGHLSVAGRRITIHSPRELGAFLQRQMNG